MNRRRPWRRPGARPCSRCGGPRDRAAAYCRKCHAAYQREHRPRYAELSDEARRRAICRSRTNMLIRRGHLDREPCEVCAAEPAQARNVSDWTDPRAVRWVCLTCFGQWRKKVSAD